MNPKTSKTLVAVANFTNRVAISTKNMMKGKPDVWRFGQPLLEKFDKNNPPSRNEAIKSMLKDLSTFGLVILAVSVIGCVLLVAYLYYNGQIHF